MKPTHLGTYFVVDDRKERLAVVAACCPFCALLTRHRVRPALVVPVRTVLALECPRCGVKETYGPQG